MISSLNKYEDSALFVGIVKSQTDKDIRTFFINEFQKENEGLFSKYKEKLINNAFKDSEKEKKNQEKDLMKGYYEPQGFILFGEADLAVISMVDDFTFGGHLFHPTHPFKTGHEDEKFYYDYQTITGYTPTITTRPLSLQNKWNNLFNSSKKLYPFIGITRIKLNSTLTVGVGKKVNLLISYLINKLITDKNKNKIKCDYLLIESFCSFEFTLLTFSNSIKAITELILSIREYSMEALEDILINCKHPDIIHLEKIISDINENSLMASWINESKQRVLPDSEQIDEDYFIHSQISELKVLDSHLFTKTQTTFGYHIDYYFRPKKCYHKIQDNEQIEYALNFSVKPGHLRSFRNLLELNHNYKFVFSEETISSGNSVLTFKYRTNGKIPIPTFNNLYFKTVNSDTNLIFDPHQNVLCNLNKIRTTFTIKISKTENERGIDLSEIEKETDKHLKVSERLKKLTFDKDKLRNIHSWLKKMGVSKVLQTRVQKMYGNFNDHIQDSTLHVFFIDLKLYLKWIYHVLDDFANNDNNTSLSDIHITINELINNFEHAFKNKHHQTYLEQNATDNNLEYSGGLHQIISGYEAFFRVVQSGMNWDLEKNAIAYVSGEPGVDSDAYAVRLNYYHLYNVQHFMGIVLKEASNFYYPSNKTIHEDINLNKVEEWVLSFLKKNRLSYERIKPIRTEISKFLFDIKKNEENVLILDFLKKNINYSLFQYVFSDYITYCYATNGKFDLFVYWHLSLFLQNPFHYNKERKIEDYNLWHTLLRLNIIRLIAIEENDDVDISRFLHKLNIENKDLFVSSNKIIADFCSLLFNNNVFNDWVKNLQKQTSNLFINKNNEANKSFDKRLLQKIMQGGVTKTEAYKSLKDHIGMIGLEKMGNKINTYHDEFLNNLKENLYTEYDLKKGDYSAFVLAVINSVLEYIEELNRKSLDILLRDQNGDPLQDNSDEELVKFLNDPFGGIFLRGHKNRSEFFKVRREVINTMSDFALKTKTELYADKILF